MYVLVYGTLMRGHANHYILQNSRYVGEGVLNDYGLYNVIPRYPGIVYKPGARVKGEVYDIDASTLSRLDHLEGEGFLYKRQSVVINCNGKKVEAFTYVWLRDVCESDYVPFEELPWRKVSREIGKKGGVSECQTTA